ncbi:MAG: hypothetical protein ACHQK8_08665, partial [Bacteroidia bacterium]
MKKKFVSIHYLSHGITETGGFRHERFLFEKIKEHFKKNDFEVSANSFRFNRVFKGFSQHKLLWLGFIDSNADVNLVVARIAVSAVLRNLFSNRKVIIVLHYFDERDRKGILLNAYYHFLFYLLRNLRPRNVSVVAVSQFWIKYFTDKFNNRIPVFLFPNFFDTVFYKKYISANKSKQIHLGQFSWKNDIRIFEVANKLSAEGYSCYFSTLNKNEAGSFE